MYIRHEEFLGLMIITMEEWYAKLAWYEPFGSIEMLTEAVKLGNTIRDDSGQSSDKMCYGTELKS